MYILPLQSNECGVAPILFDKMRAMITWKRLGWLGFFSLLPGFLFAAETFLQDDDHRGVVHVGEYQIFPEKRWGNGLYLNNELLVTFPNRQILEVYEIPNAESLVYLYAEAQQKLAMGLYDLSQQEQARIKNVDDEFYEVWVFALGIRKIFRIYQNKIQSVAPHLRTATGVTPSHSHIAYYHITNSEVIEVDGANQRVYDFRIHILKREAAEPQNLNMIVRDSRSILKLSWVDARTLRYELSDGTLHEIDVAAQLPNYF